MPTSFFDQVGPMAIGSRLRHVSGLITEDARRTYDLYDVRLEPKWWPVFYVLSNEPEGISTTEIARRIGHSHACVSQITTEMKADGLISTARDESDGRVNVIQLTGAAHALIPRHRVQCSDVSEAVDELLSETSVDLWEALAEIERRLEERSLFDRVKDRYRRRQDEQVEIVDYRDEHQEAFRDLNLAWIQKYWEVEDTDRKYLDHPRETILDPGGAILMAEYDGEIVGTVALIPMEPEEGNRLELAKMAVDERVRGKGIGWRLGRAALQRARELGATSVYLESNSILEPAIALYRKLGFKTVPGRASPYARCNVQMEIALEPGPDATAAPAGS